MKKTSSSNKSQRRRAREYVVQALYQWQLSPLDQAELIAQFSQQQDFSKVDADYWQQLLSKTITEVKRLDDIITPHLSRPFSAVSPVELAILRMAVCELAFFLEIPYRVVINEALEVTKCFGAVDSHRFMNGVLDKCLPLVRAHEGL